MSYIRVPARINRGTHVFQYVEQVNDKMYLYKEEKLGYKECFLLQDLVKMEKVNILKGLPHGR